MTTTGTGTLAPSSESHRRNLIMTESDAAQLLIDAVRRGDTFAAQRVTRRPDIARIALELAERIACPPLQPCGTRSAAERHIANGEPLDDACAEARRSYYRVRARRVRATRSPTTSTPAVDPVVVERLIDGQPPLHVTRAERAEAVRLLDQAGKTRSEIAVQLHMSGGRVAQILDATVTAATHTSADNNRQEASA